MTARREPKLHAVVPNRSPSSEGRSTYGAAERYRTVMARRTTRERQLLAYAKRVLERYRGDPYFRVALAASQTARRTALDACGVHLDPQDAVALVQEHAAGPCDVGSPLLNLWRDYVGELGQLPGVFCEAGRCPHSNPRFDRWRSRQIARVKSEMGSLGDHILHPILAFELSSGCSISCWFCGVSAGRLSETFPYTVSNRRLWRAVLKEAVTLFGGATQTGFCYWATDPADNPDYLEFIEDYLEVTGALPPTTTAAPLRDPAFTRRLIELQATSGSMPDRFSILTLKTLERVHATFTAEELLGVELVMHHPEASAPKAMAGRAMTAKGRAAKAANLLPGATIACVTGFLVNMVERTVRLVSPVRPSRRWPLGYRVFGAAQFDDPVDFRRVAADLIAEYTPSVTGDLLALAFRADLAYHGDADRFLLTSAASRYCVAGFAGARWLGDRLHRADASAGEIEAEAAARGIDIFAVASVLENLFERGLLAE